LQRRNSECLNGCGESASLEALTGLKDPPGAHYLQDPRLVSAGTLEFLVSCFWFLVFRFPVSFQVRTRN
jgi:hypothetical protein